MPIRDNSESDPKANPWSGPGAIPQACPLVRFEGHPLELILGAVPKSIHLARPEANAWASLEPPTRQVPNLPVQPVYRALQLGVASAVLLSGRPATGAILRVHLSAVVSSRGSFSRGDLHTSAQLVKY